MNKTLLIVPLVAAAFSVKGQTDAVVPLPEVTVHSPKVANQDSAATFAMPVSALRYDPRVDVQARNLAEGQADVSIRGGIFENTGFKLGALNLYDPQTGHYFAEIPIAPAMLGAPDLLTGTSNAFGGFNAAVGTVAYSWRPIRTVGTAILSGGEYDTNREEIYQGYLQQLSPEFVAATGIKSVGVDLSFARSESDGSVPYGDHYFNRYNGRIQLQSALGQTDLVAGYQSKFFGWPNLYTPFGVNETEDLQTTLFALNHRKSFDNGDYVQFGSYWRRNRDDYEYNRFIPGLYNPYKHTTWVYGFALEGRETVSSDGVTLNYAANTMFDRLQSTSLIYGHFNHRDYFKVTLLPEKTWKTDNASEFVLKAGGTFDDTNKDSSAFSPVVEFDYLTKVTGKGVRKVYVSYAKSTQVASYTALNSSATSGLFRGNPNLERSQSHNIELGTTLPFGDWQVQSAVFWRYDDKLVDWTYKQGVNARTANPVDIGTTGFELTLSRTWGPVQTVFGYTALTKDADYGSSAVDASFYALNYAKQRLTAAVVARLGHGFELRLDNEVRMQKENALRKSPHDEMVISAIGLSYRPPLFSSLVLNAQVDNLWNTNFEEVPGTPGSRRVASVGVLYAW